jgi:G6PDH family F420-dependent oxidoreductase
MRIGYFLSCEEFGPAELLRQARMAEEAGFEGLWISDHYHPWNDEQGESPFVWSVIGALSQVTERIPITTAVTCPTIRIHPAIMAQAAATAAAMLPGRFRFGVGTGEALNEHILGDHWPSADVRLEMLEEAIAVVRELWTGGQVEYDGTHYLVENARVYTLPDELPPILVSGFGPKAVDVAARVGDGFVLVGPDADLVRRYRSNGGGDRLVQSGTKVCWGADEAECVKTVHRLWPNEALPGELPQVLPTPAHFEQACELVSEQMIAESVVCGPDTDRHVAELQQFADAGIDEVYVQQIGGDHEGFFAAYAEHVLPRLG